jgi:rod shape-determining protein MreC
MLKLKSNHFGSLIWNGKSTGFVQLIDVPRLAAVRKGDTIVPEDNPLFFPKTSTLEQLIKYKLMTKLNIHNC